MNVKDLIVLLLVDLVKEETTQIKLNDFNQSPTLWKTLTNFPSIQTQRYGENSKVFRSQTFKSPFKYDNFEKFSQFEKSEVIDFCFSLKTVKIF